MKPPSPKKKRFEFKKTYALLKYYAVGLYHKFEEDHVWIMSASIAFNIVICIIPFTLILFSILGFYLPKEGTTVYIDKAMSTVVGMTPELKTKITNTVIKSIDELSRNSVLTAIIGTLGILWTASGLFGTIRDVLNRIYKTREDVFYLWGKLRDIGMVILISLVFLLSFSSTFIISIFKAIDTSFFGNTLMSLDFTTNIITHGIGIIFSFIMFYLIFKLVPEGFVNSTVAVISSITAAVLSESLKYLFLLYLLFFADYQRIYGAYAAIVAVIFWIYYSSFTFVVGAEIGQLYKEKKLISQTAS